MPRDDTSTRNDQPPCGGMTVKSFSSSSNTSRRCRHSETQTLIPSFGSLIAVATAPIAMPVWQTTLLMLTRAMSAIRPAGPTIQPTNHSVFLGCRADRNNFIPHVRKRRRVNYAPAVVKNALHRRVVDNQAIGVPAEFDQCAPIIGIENCARWHCGAHQEREFHGCRIDMLKRIRIQLPALIRRHQRHISWHTTGQSNPIDQADINRICHEDFVAGLQYREQHV